MGRDIFVFGGIAQGEGEQRQIMIRDTRLARITRQRRCAPDIWNRVARLYTDVQCRVDEDRVRPLSEYPPLPGQSFVLVDIGDGDEAVCSRAGGSWQNEYSATVAMKLIQQLTNTERNQQTPLSIAVIAPYRAQIKLIKQKLRQQPDSLSAQRVEAGTIHQFQGSEADLVIFDVVDSKGRTELGRLLQGDTGIRLVNVAITRARGKVILLVSRKWCLANVTRSANPLLWDIVRNSPADIIVPAAQWLAAR